MRRWHFFFLMVMIVVGAFGAAAQDTATYTVETGDVLDLIAAGFDVDTNCLADANDLDNPNKLKTGQVLLIDFSCPLYHGPAEVTNPREPGEAQTAAGDQGGGEAAPQPGPNDQTYTVEGNDTLDTIGQQFDVSVISLELANNLEDPNKLFAGDVLIIPADAPAYGQYPALTNPRVAAGAKGDTELGQGGGGPAVGPGDELYVVQPRDVLDLIAAQFDKQADCIAESNNIADNPHLLYAGQALVIPGNCPPYDGLAFPNRDTADSSG